MNKFKFAALAAVLLLQSLAYPANAPSHSAVSDHVAAVSLKGDRPAADRLDDSRDYLLLPDLQDSHREDCDPEDDCPRR